MTKTTETKTTETVSSINTYPVDLLKSDPATRKYLTVAYDRLASNVASRFDGRTTEQLFERIERIESRLQRTHRELYAAHSNQAADNLANWIDFLYTSRQAISDEIDTRYTLRNRC